MKLYYQKDAKSEHLKGKTVAILGYGSQGHAHAQNLRDSGINVIVGELEGTKNHELAVDAGFDVMSAGESAERADIIVFLTPDQTHSKIYNDHVSSKLKSGKTLVFAHGFNIHYGQINPPQNVDVWMVAPKSPGHLVRRVYEAGGGVPCLMAVYQNSSGKAKEIALAYADAIGGTRAGVLETTFAEETETDLFGEQSAFSA